MANDSYVTYEQVFRWYTNARRQNPKNDLAATIADRIDGASDQTERDALTTALCWEHQRQGRYAEAAAILEKQAVAHPDDPQPLISLASQCLYHEENPKKAMAAIDRAIVTAEKSGNFQRYALGVKARTALALQRYDVLEKCLDKIASVELLPGQRDVAKERDIFDRAPKDQISAETLQRYEVFLRRG